MSNSWLHSFDMIVWGTCCRETGKLPGSFSIRGSPPTRARHTRRLREHGPLRGRMRAPRLRQHRLGTVERLVGNRPVVHRDRPRLGGVDERLTAGGSSNAVVPSRRARSGRDVTTQGRLQRSSAALDGYRMFRCRGSTRRVSRTVTISIRSGRTRYTIRYGASINSRKSSRWHFSTIRPERDAQPTARHVA